jgi:predicted GIY-YIG superfamily endonuclease
VEDRPQALYRFYDADDVLLYVGITHDPPQRLQSHGSTAFFWTDVAKIKIEWCANRKEARDKERDAIKAEGPRYNKQHAQKIPRHLDERYRGWAGGPPNAYMLAWQRARGDGSTPLGPTMRYVMLVEGLAIEWDDGMGFIYATIADPPQSLERGYTSAERAERDHP